MGYWYFFEIIKFIFLAGQERYHTLSKSYYRSSNGALIIFDITSQTSFNHIDEWIKEVHSVVDNITIYIVKIIIFIGWK